MELRRQPITPPKGAVWSGGRNPERVDAEPKYYQGDTWDREEEELAEQVNELMANPGEVRELFADLTEPEYALFYQVIVELYPERIYHPRNPVEKAVLSLQCLMEGAALREIDRRGTPK